MRARDPPEDLDRRADSHREREHAKDRVVRSLQVFGLKAAATKAHQALEHEHHEHVAGCGAHRRADVVERRCGPREVGHVAGPAEHVVELLPERRSWGGNNGSTDGSVEMVSDSSVS